MRNKFVFTCGDINGIGPEIIIKSLNSLTSDGKSKYYVICPPSVFEKTATNVKPEFDFEITKKSYNFNLPVTIIPLNDVKHSFGKPTRSSGKTAYNAIKLAVKMAANKDADAIVTAPISKKAINMAGINFPGHTEMLAEWTGTKHFVMTFLSKKMKAALVTIHDPLSKIPRLIKQERLHNTFNVVINSLQNDFNISHPSVAVLGLNPHAGEEGIIGREEIEIIKPALKSFRIKKILSGPFSPDAFFANRMYNNFDLVIGMYHDQLLIPFKLLNFGGGVNYTAGLPIVRTSPDHGVAYDIAGKNIADPSSFLEAVKYAQKIVSTRRINAKENS